MLGFARALFRPGDTERLSVADWTEMFSFNGQSYPINFAASNVNSSTEDIENDFEGYVASAYKRNGVVFACVNGRARIFSQARFQYQNMRKGKPGDLFSTPDLTVLETPWPNGSTQEALFRAIQDVDLAGNSYMLRESRTRIRRLRPDWVEILLSAPPDKATKSDVVAYIYKRGGSQSPDDWEIYPIDGSNGVVAHWSPIPDPVAQYRGMSWLTPILTDIAADTAMQKHKLMFLKNGAQPGIAVTLKQGTTADQFEKFMEKVNRAHNGVDNAYKTMFLGAGADVHVIGTNLQQMDFKVTQGHAECLAVDTPLPTPSGWVSMAAVAVGDQVLGRDGRPVNVIGVYGEHLNRDCYRISMKDGTSIVADASHIWPSIDQRSGKRDERLRTTVELFNLFTQPFMNGVGGNRLALMGSPIVELPEVSLPIDPYLLGAWLGDGYSSDAAICGAEDDLKHIIDEIERRTGYAGVPRKPVPGKVPVVGFPGGLRAQLRDLGVLNNKHIPQQYLRGSVAQRLALLRGLMDTDGFVSANAKNLGRCQFSSKWEHLARQVAELVRSLGYRASLIRAIDSRSRTGEDWKVTFRSRLDAIPFLLPRKVDRCLLAGDPNVNARSIVNIERVDSVPVRCIMVDAEDHLFLAGEGFVPTHNTRIASAAGIHPSLLGLAEQMHGTPLNQGNFQSAKDLLYESVLAWMWPSICTAWAQLVPTQQGARLWYDSDGIPFLRQDRTELAKQQTAFSAALSSLVMQGWTPETSRDALIANDMSLLVHSGLISVQLFQPGQGPSSADQPQSTGPAMPGGPANANVAKTGPAKPAGKASAAPTKTPAKPAATPAKGQ